MTRTKRSSSDEDMTIQVKGSAKMDLSLSDLNIQDDSDGGSRNTSVSGDTIMDLPPRANQPSFMPPHALSGFIEPEEKKASYTKKHPTPKKDL